jgi:uncharacterized protein (DUF302 family)
MPARGWPPIANTQEDNTMHRILLAVTAMSIALSGAAAGTVTVRDGWVVIDTRQSFPTLVERLEAAVKAEKIGLVTSASASEGAKAAGIAIPGNRVVGVFRNDFARRMLSASVSAGIETQIRFYVTENPDGTATLSYKEPGFVFAPDLDDGKDALRTLASELDDVFAKIADQASKEQ